MHVLLEKRCKFIAVNSLVGICRTPEGSLGVQETLNMIQAPPCCLHHCSHHCSHHHSHHRSHHCSHTVSSMDMHSC